jgi:hypothetical protein
VPLTAEEIRAEAVATRFVSFSSIMDAERCDAVAVQLGKDDWSAFFLYTVAESRIDAEALGMDASALGFLSGCFCFRAEVSLLVVLDGLVLLDFNAGILLVRSRIANITGRLSLRGVGWYAHLFRNRPPLGVCLPPAALDRLRLVNASICSRSNHFDRLRTCRSLCQNNRNHLREIGSRRVCLSQNCHGILVAVLRDVVAPTALDEQVIGKFEERYGGDTKKRDCRSSSEPSRGKIEQHANCNCGFPASIDHGRDRVSLTGG